MRTKTDIRAREDAEIGTTREPFRFATFPTRVWASVVCFVLFAFSVVNPVSGATIYGNLRTGQGVPWVTSVKFTPQSTPFTLDPFLFGSPVVSTNSDTNGFFSVNLVQGDWLVQLGPNSRDTFHCPVDGTTNSYNIDSLITNLPSFTFPYSPAYVMKVGGPGGVMQGNLSWATTNQVGLIVNNLTSAQRLALPGTNGMMVYDTTLQQMLRYEGGAWLAFGGGGTVTSVGLALPGSIFQVSGSPVGAVGTLTGALVNQSANTFFGGPVSGASAVPGFRAIVAADVPALTIYQPATAALSNYSAVLFQPASGNLSNFSTVPTNYFVVANAPITGGMGTKVSYGANGLVTGSTSLSAGDIPSITLSKISDAGTAAGHAATDFLAVPGGLAAGDLLYFNGSSFSRLPIGSVGQVLYATNSTVAWLTPGSGGGGGAAPAHVYIWDTNIVTTASSNWANLSILTGSITPASSSSVIKVSVNLVLASANDFIEWRVLRVIGSTTNEVAPAAATLSGQYSSFNSTFQSNADQAPPYGWSFVDAPVTTSAVTYYVQWRSGLSGVTISYNRSLNDTTGNWYSFRSSSNLILEEWK
jgi:hypothetical protein